MPRKRPSSDSTKPKRYVRVLPKQLDDALLSRLESFGLARLDTKAIAALLSCTEQEIEDRRNTDREFDQALTRGRARATDNAAAVVLAAMQGTDIVTRDPQGNVIKEKVSPTMLEAAKFYLAKHAPHWLGEK